MIYLQAKIGSHGFWKRLDLADDVPRLGKHGKERPIAAAPLRQRGRFELDVAGILTLHPEADIARLLPQPNAQSSAMLLRPPPRVAAALPLQAGPDGSVVLQPRQQLFEHEVIVDGADDQVLARGMQRSGKRSQDRSGASLRLPGLPLRPRRHPGTCHAENSPFFRGAPRSVGCKFVRTGKPA